MVQQYIDLTKKVWNDRIATIYSVYKYIIALNVCCYRKICVSNAHLLPYTNTCGTTNCNEFAYLFYLSLRSKFQILKLLDTFQLSLSHGILVKQYGLQSDRTWKLKKNERVLKDLVLLLPNKGLTFIVLDFQKVSHINCIRNESIWMEYYILHVHVTWMLCFQISSISKFLFAWYCQIIISSLDDNY